MTDNSSSAFQWTRIELFRRDTLAATAGVVAGLAGLRGATTTVTAQQDDPTKIEDWFDLDAVREELEGDYVLVENLDATTTGYDEVVAEPTRDAFTRERSAGDGTITEGKKITLAHTPLDTVTVTDSDGDDIEVEIADPAAGTIVIQERPTGSLTIEYTTTEPNVVGFDPIGDSDGSWFSGTFDGNGNTISELFINRPTMGGIGLFGVIDDDAELSGIELVDADVTGESLVGGLVGWNVGGTIEQAHVAGLVSGNEAVGGIVGTNREGGITASSATGTVTGGGRFIGGLVGQNTVRGDISMSFAQGDVTGESRVGGLVGENDILAEITASYARGTVTGESKVGGLVGRNDRSTIEQSYAAGAVDGDEHVGGLVGQLGGELMDEDEVAVLEDSYWDSQTVGQGAAVGIREAGDGTTEIRGDVAGLDSDQMRGEQADEHMVALDFAETWATVTDDYPVLQVLAAVDGAGAGDESAGTDDSNDSNDIGADSDEDDDADNVSPGDDDGGNSDGSGPGFGVGGAVAGLGGAAYLLKRRLMGEQNGGGSDE